MKLRKKSIRKLKEEQQKLRDEFHKISGRIDDEIEAIRRARGTKLVEYSWEDYHEEGRSEPWEVRVSRGH